MQSAPDIFKTNFHKFINTPITLYGIGINTKEIVEVCDEFNIIGLLDEVRTGDVFYGKPVISLDEALGRGVEAIIIIARPSNVNIIYRRIADFCTKNNISVYTINGDILSDRNEIEFTNKYDNINESILKAKIKAADVVSFDVFDTLVMRQCLYPRDIFYLIGSDFAEERIKVEMELYAEGIHASIFEIYQRMNGDYSTQKELEVESQYLLPRHKMLDMINFARDLGKEVWLVSDMYLPREIIHGFLDVMDIFVDLEQILVSCDFGCAKNNGLFDILRSKVGAKKILHIGDNYEVDILSAKRYGIDDTFYLESSLAMLENSFAKDLLKYDSELSNRLLLGYFVSRLLNNPFIFSKTKGKLYVESDNEVACYFIAPIVYGLFNWMVNKAMELKIDIILLGARDGFIFERIYHSLRETHDFPDMKYFHTSRAVSLVSGIFEDDDILSVAKYSFSGTVEEMLVKRFKVEPLHREEESDDEYILRHRKQIFAYARQMRENYLKYISSLNIDTDKRIGFFDLISSGSCQIGMEKTMGIDLTGLYLAQVDGANRGTVNIESMYGILSTVQEKYHLHNQLFLLETIITSYVPTLAGFTEDGKPIFAEEYRDTRRLLKLRQMHNVIIENSWLLDVTKGVDKELPDEIIGLIDSKYCDFGDVEFADADIRDDFLKRKK